MYPTLFCTNSNDNIQDEIYHLQLFCFANIFAAVRQLLCNEPSNIVVEFSSRIFKRFLEYIGGVFLLVFASLALVAVFAGMTRYKIFLYIVDAHLTDGAMCYRRLDLRSIL